MPLRQKSENQLNRERGEGQSLVPQKGTRTAVAKREEEITPEQEEEEMVTTEQEEEQIPTVPPWENPYPEKIASLDKEIAEIQADVNNPDYKNHENAKWRLNDFLRSRERLVAAYENWISPLEGRKNTLQQQLDDGIIHPGHRENVKKILQCYREQPFKWGSPGRRTTFLVYKGEVVAEMPMGQVGSWVASDEQCEAFGVDLVEEYTTSRGSFWTERPLDRAALRIFPAKEFHREDYDWPECGGSWWVTVQFKHPKDKRKPPYVKTRDFMLDSGAEVGCCYVNDIKTLDPDNTLDVQVCDITGVSGSATYNRYFVDARIVDVEAQEALTHWFPFGVCTSGSKEEGKTRIMSIRAFEMLFYAGKLGHTGLAMGSSERSVREKYERLGGKVPYNAQFPQRPPPTRRNPLDQPWRTGHKEAVDIQYEAEARRKEEARRRAAGGRGYDTGGRRHETGGRGYEAAGRGYEAEGRSYGTGDRRYETGDRGYEAGGRRHEAGNRGYEAGGHRNEAEGRGYEAGGRRHEAGDREHGAGFPPQFEGGIVPPRHRHDPADRSYYNPSTRNHGTRHRYDEDLTKQFERFGINDLHVSSDRSNSPHGRRRGTDD